MDEGKLGVFFSDFEAMCAAQSYSIWKSECGAHLFDLAVRYPAGLSDMPPWLYRLSHFLEDCIGSWQLYPELVGYFQGELKVERIIGLGYV